MLRPEVWPFLLHYFPFDSSFQEREQLRNDKYIEYHNIRKIRWVMSYTHSRTESLPFRQMHRCSIYLRIMNAQEPTSDWFLVDNGQTFQWIQKCINNMDNCTGTLPMTWITQFTSFLICKAINYLWFSTAKRAHLCSPLDLYCCALWNPLKKVFLYLIHIHLPGVFYC